MQQHVLLQYADATRCTHRREPHALGRPRCASCISLSGRSSAKREGPNDDMYFFLILLEGDTLRYSYVHLAATWASTMLEARRPLL